jgi:hypothetical protein
MADLQAKLKIPDLWYDFYARFLPGSVFVAYIYYYLLVTPTWPTSLQAVILGIGAYLCGLVTQPLASVLTKLLHTWVEGRREQLENMPKNEQKDDELKKGKKRVPYVLQIAQYLEPHERNILSKMHGEVSFFAQCFILSLTLIGLQVILGVQLGSVKVKVAVALFALSLGLLQAYQRRRRAEVRLRLLKLIASKPDQPLQPTDSPADSSND